MTLTITLVVIVLFVASLTRATFGFGDAMLAMPLLALIIGPRSAAPLVALVALSVGVALVLFNRKGVHFPSAARLIVASLLGIPLGLYGLTAVGEVPVKVALAAVVLLFATLGLIRPQQAELTLKTERASWVFGLIAGVLGGAYNTNGPVVVLYGALRGWPKEGYRSTLQAYFCATGAFVVAGHGVTGTLTAEVWRLYLLALPAVAGAFLLGGLLNRKLPTERFQTFVYALLLLTGGALLVSVFF